MNEDSMKVCMKDIKYLINNVKFQIKCEILAKQIKMQEAQLLHCEQNFRNEKNTIKYKPANAGR